MDKLKTHIKQTILDEYPHLGNRLHEKINHRYESIVTEGRFNFEVHNPFDKRLDISAYLLAFVMILDEQDESFETIRSICLNAARAYAKPKNKFTAWLKQLQGWFVGVSFVQFLFTKMNPRMMRNPNSDGFIAQVVTDKDETYGLGYGVDILECGICKLFARYDYQNYAPILCEFDKILAEIAGLELVRTGTIANGANKCDFRFKKRF